MYTEDSSKRIQEILNQFTPKKTPIKIEKKPNVSSNPLKI